MEFRLVIIAPLPSRFSQKIPYTRSVRFDLGAFIYITRFLFIFLLGLSLAGVAFGSSGGGELRPEPGSVELSVSM